jgi:hypothetical protein
MKILLLAAGAIVIAAFIPEAQSFIVLLFSGEPLSFAVWGLICFLLLLEIMGLVPEGNEGGFFDWLGDWFEDSDDADGD